MTDRIRTPSYAIPRRDLPGEDKEVARLKAMMTAMLGEMTIMRERIDTIERVAEDRGAFARHEIEDYMPDAAANQERDALRVRMIGKVMRQLRIDAEIAASQASERMVSANAFLQEEESL